MMKTSKDDQRGVYRMGREWILYERIQMPNSTSTTWKKVGEVPTWRKAEEYLNGRDPLGMTSSDTRRSVDQFNFNTGKGL